MKCICDPRTWQTLLASDFNRGYLAALMLVLALVLALMILKLLWFIAFRTRRASTVTIPHPDGDIVVSREALAEAVTRELAGYPELRLRKLRLFRRGKNYLLTLLCEFNGADGVPVIASELRTKLKERLKRLFGLESLKSVKIVIEKLAAAPAGRELPELPETPAETAQPLSQTADPRCDAADPGL